MLTPDTAPARHKASKLTTAERRAAQPSFKGERRWLTFRLELKIYDRITQAAAIRGDTLTEWVAGALDVAAIADIERDRQHIEQRQAARAEKARAENPQTDIEDTLGKVIPIKAEAGDDTRTRKAASRATPKPDRRKK